MRSDYSLSAKFVGFITEISSRYKPSFITSDDRQPNIAGEWQQAMRSIVREKDMNDRMNHKNGRKQVWISIGMTTAAAGLILAVAIPAEADRHHEETFTVDVAVDHATFALVPSTGLVEAPEGTGPNRGAPFIVNGKIFPAGTLHPGDGQGDPNQPGSIGTWFCKGIFTSDLLVQMSGLDKIGFNTTQMLEFDGDRQAIWTEGLEGGLGEAGVITHRIILGGTGHYRGASGEVVQESLGTNLTGTPNIRLRFRIERDGRG
jgi:hypothetical protein